MEHITEKQVSELGFTLRPSLRVGLIFHHGGSIFDFIQSLVLDADLQKRYISGICLLKVHFLFAALQSSFLLPVMRK